MRPSMVLSLAAAALMVAASGCCNPCSYPGGSVANPYGGVTIGATPPCGGCGAAQTCGPAGCGPSECGTTPCGPGACGPFSMFQGLLGCRSGCGEVYWNEWYNDPPDKCEPCDTRGNWIGSTCCPPRWCGLLGVLWGVQGPCPDAPFLGARAVTTSPYQVGAPCCESHATGGTIIVPGTVPTPVPTGTLTPTPAQPTRHLAPAQLKAALMAPTPR